MLLLDRVRDLMVKIVYKCIYKEFLEAKIVGAQLKSTQKIFLIFFSKFIATVLVNFHFPNNPAISGRAVFPFLLALEVILQYLH